MHDPVLGTNPRQTVIAHLARRFDTSERARTVLQIAGFNRTTLPTFNEPIAFWSQAFESIADGLGPADNSVPFVGGIGTLMEAAMTYPDGNGVFAAALRHYRPESSDAAVVDSAASPRHSATSGREQVARLSGGALLIVRGVGDSARRRTIRERVNELARQQGVASNLLEEASDLMRWHLPQSDVNGAIALRDGLIRDRSLGLGIAQTYVSQAQLPDQNIAQLFVEGPDQGRLVLSDVPRGTRVGSVAQAVVNEYRQAWPTDKQQQPRAAVVNLTQEDGNRERLRPEDTLEQAGVGEGAQLQIHPESTAGSINPLLREEALRRANVQILTFADTASRRFVVRANATFAPTYYEFDFEAPSFAPPASTGGSPIPNARHTVSLELAPDFPMVAPAVIWRTPIFHPNISAKNDATKGAVCLGELADRYRPGLDFADLCRTLVEIASFLNYEIREGYNREAADWVVSPEGQSAIESIGGRSLRQSFASTIVERIDPRRLKIRRIGR